MDTTEPCLVFKTRFDDADLSNANLARVKLGSGVVLKRAKYSKTTRWPDGFSIPRDALLWSTPSTVAVTNVPTNTSTADMHTSSSDREMARAATAASTWQVERQQEGSVAKDRPLKPLPSIKRSTPRANYVLIELLCGELETNADARFGEALRFFQQRLTAIGMTVEEAAQLYGDLHNEEERGKPAERYLREDLQLPQAYARALQLSLMEHKERAHALGRELSALQL